jgi:hypothetical protein
MSKEQEERSIGTADFVAGVNSPPQRNPDKMSDETSAASSVSDAQMQEAQPQHEPLAALFAPEVARDFQSRWDAVQIGFVDDPGDAVRQADELVAQVMKSLAESFANERERIESQLDQSTSESTENMRVALHRYRSFFQRLLSL